MDLRGELPTHPTKRYKIRGLESVTYLAIHHTGTTFPCTAEMVANYHIRKGWPGAGYHALLEESGVLYLMNDVQAMTYGIHGRNHECLHLAVSGSFLHGRRPTLEQVRSLPRAIQYMASWYRRELGDLLRAVHVRGHNELAVPGWGTECPGDLSF